MSKGPRPDTGRPPRPLTAPPAPVTDEHPCAGPVVVAFVAELGVDAEAGTSVVLVRDAGVLVLVSTGVRVGTVTDASSSLTTCLDAWRYRGTIEMLDTATGIGTAGLVGTRLT